MPPTKETQLIDKKNLIIKDADRRKDEDEDVPIFLQDIDLTDQQVIRLRKEIFERQDVLQKQRETLDMKNKWDEWDAQYDGEMDDKTDSQFSLHVHVTKIKIDTLDTLASKAFLESDPKFVVTARPETMREGTEDTVVEAVPTKQEDYLDYLFDEDVKVRVPLRQAIHSSSKRGLGIFKLVYEYITKRKKRYEEYSGKSEKDTKTGKTIQPGLKDFTQQYPDSVKEDNKDHHYVKALTAGKDIEVEVDYDGVVYNNPKPYYVDIRDFWIDVDTEGYQGFCESQVMIEKEQYSWWELKKKEARGEFQNVEEVKFTGPQKEGQQNREEIKDYTTKKFGVYKSTYWFNMGKDGKSDESSEDPEDEVRIECWFSIDSRAFLGAIYYPWHNVESAYIPFYISDKETGLYKNSMTEDLTDNNLAQNALLNFTLTGMWIENTITPIVREGSTIAQQFLEKRWDHGVPLEVSKTAPSLDSELGFLEKKPMNSNEFISTLMFLGKMAGDTTRISDTQATGEADPVDPRAPAAKTAMLLRQSGVNIEDYINCLLPSFNLIGEISLQLVYQMSKSGRKYKQRKRAQAVTGGNLFTTIQPDEMVAKTSIQSQAAGFAFDKINEKRENLALYQVLRNEASVFQNPSAIYQLTRTLIKSWSPMWKNKVDSIWPTPEEFNAEQVKIVAKALQIYLAQLAEQRKVTGVDPEVNMDDFMKLAQQMQVVAMTPEAAEGAK